MASPTLELGAGVVVPTAAFLLNWRMREVKGYALSAAADFVLAVMVFDLMALVTSHVFEKAVSDRTLRDGFVALFVILFCVSLILWAWALLPLEHKLGEGYDRVARKYRSGRPMTGFLAAWMLVAILLSCHLFPFLYGLTS